MIIIRQIFLAVAALAAGAIAAGPFEQYLETVRANSPALRAASKNAEAEVLGAHIDVTPPDPVVDAGYFPGNRPEIGNKTTAGISLDLAFPTVYAGKRRMAGLTSAKMNIVRKSAEIELLERAAQNYIELVFLNKYCAVVEKRADEAGHIKTMVSRKLDAGDANVLEVQKATVEEARIRNDLALLNARRTGALRELTLFCGDKQVVLPDIVYPDLHISSFEQFLALVTERSPELQRLAADEKILTQEVKLRKSMRLPQFRIGVSGEKTADDIYRGVQGGLTLPLWQQRYTVESAVARRDAIRMEYDSRKMAQISAIRSAGELADTLERNLERSRELLRGVSAVLLLRKSLDAGSISIITYYQERRYWFDTMDRYLEDERDLHKVLAGLVKYTW